jgi:lysozyme
MNSSENGLLSLVRHEGIVPAPYRDIAGVWTWGIGHAETSGQPPNPRTMPRGMPSDVAAVIPEAFRLFKLRLGPYEDAVRRTVKVPLAQHEFDALTSLCFNIGPGNFAKSSVVRHLNAGDRAAAADAFRAWNKARNPATGKLEVSNGLVRRRAEERALFLTGSYTTGAVPIYTVSADGQLGRVLRNMSEAEVRTALRAQRPSAARPVTPAPQPAADNRFVALLRALGLLPKRDS